jgi:ferredoxin--NADP+ reductase
VSIAFPDVAMNLVRPKSPVVARVVSNESCMSGKSASFVKHTVFDVTDTPLAGSFRAGQSFGVITPGTDARGKPHKVRLYSIACPTWGEDGDARHLSTTPKRLIDEFVPQRPNDDPTDHSLFLGVCSNYLCDLKAGDEVALTGPQGRRFLLPSHADEHDYLFIATGTGIAPFRGMVMELLQGEQPTRSRIDLVMGVPYASDLLYDDLFRELARAHDNFNYHTATSRESERLYVDALLDQQISYFAPLLGNARTLIYVCGLEGMQTGLFRVLGRHDLATGYLDERSRPTERCMLEVY